MSLVGMTWVVIFSAKSNFINWEGLLVVSEITLQTLMLGSTKVDKVLATSFFYDQLDVSDDSGVFSKVNVDVSGGFCIAQADENKFFWRFLSQLTKMICL